MVQNDNSVFIENLKKIPSFNGKIKYAGENLTRLGSGSGRVVYAIDDNRVLKLAKNQKGIAQNSEEINASSYKDYDDILTDIYDSANDDSWIIAERAKKTTEKRFKSITGFNVWDIYTYVRNFYEENRGKRPLFSISPELKERLYNDEEFTQRITSFISNYNQSPGDLGRVSSYGEVVRNGQPSIVLTDYGLTDEVYDTYYNPSRKQKMYEFYDKNDNHNAIDENFIKFVINRNDYPNKQISNIPYLLDCFYDCVENIENYLKKVNNKKQFYNNLLMLQNYLISQNAYDRDPLPIAEEVNMLKESLDRNIADTVAKKIAELRGYTQLNYLGGGNFGAAYDIGDNKVLKITTDKSEAVENLNLKGKTLKYIAEPYEVLKINNKSGNDKELYGIILEKLKTDGEKFNRIRKRLDFAFNKILNLNFGDVIDYYVNNNDIFGDITDKKKNLIDKYFIKNPEDANYFNGLLKIGDEAKRYGVESMDYMNPDNIGYKKDGSMGFFDVGFGNYYSTSKELPVEINVNEDGSSNFSTDSNVGQDGFPIYNQNDTSPMIDNNILVNVNERILSSMSNSNTVDIKKNCRLGGKGETSDACNQGDINNLIIKPLTEEIDASEAYRDEDAIKAMLNNRKDVAIIMFSHLGDEIINNPNFKLISVKQNHHDIDMRIVYKIGAEEKAKRLYEIMKSHGGYVNDQTPEEAYEIGKLLSYSDESIKKYIDRRYGKIPVVNDVDLNSIDENVDMGDNINKFVNDLKNVQFIKALIENNYEVYLVGGAVRDLVLNKPNKDIDLVIRKMSIDDLITFLQKYGRVDVVGKSFGVIKFIDNNGVDYDIALPRSDKKNDSGGYHGFDIQSDKNLPIEADLIRRDAKFNAMAINLNTGKFIDPLGGMNDIKNKQISAANPEAFSDDPLRMLRIIQFASRFGFSIELETMKMIQNNAERITT
jgi:hypothetical protein